jgi:hypothetical protein
MDEKLIELVRKYEELYDMSNKKYSDSAAAYVHSFCMQNEWTYAAA